MELPDDTSLHTHEPRQVIGDRLRVLTAAAAVAALVVCC